MTKAKNESISFTAPHWAATDAGIRILQQGGTATEAMVAAAAVITVVYPHMNSIGGDSFWLVHEQGSDQPYAIDACGRSAAQLDQYEGKTELPNRGGEAAITQAATIRGWQVALSQDSHAKLPLKEILKDAINWARKGIVITPSLRAALVKVTDEGQMPESFRRLYGAGEALPEIGSVWVNTALAHTFERLAENGLEDFYTGDIAKNICASLQRAGSPLTESDIAQTKAELVTPLSVRLSNATLFNLPAPTQGVHSLQILAIADRLKTQVNTDAQWTHLIVEATKQAFHERQSILTDLDYVPSGYYQALDNNHLDDLAAKIDLNNAKPWPFRAEHGDTVWMGARDAKGQMVSFIQSIYWEFGSGVVVDNCGFVWNNRGISFSLDGDDINCLAECKKPRHTLNPAFAIFHDGARLSYGTMGGEGQPQTQAAIFSRFAWQEKSLQRSVAQDRWLLGRTWGDDSNNLKIEANLAEEIGAEMTGKNHDWVAVASNNEMMGHAGAILETNEGEVFAATDPRSDGKSSVTI
jgi:gamma-glutamyltranspeptidase/glutathione hydrolase